MKRYLILLTALVILTGCATPEWDPQPKLMIDGEFTGTLVMHDPSPPPEHPGWRVADTLLSTLGVVALPYLLLREGARTVQPPTVVQQPEPLIVRPEVITFGRD